MTDEDFKGLPRRTASDKVLRDKACNIAKNPKFDGDQHGLASMVYKFFDKNMSNTKLGTGTNCDVVSEKKENAEELHKLIITKFEKQKSHSSFIDKIWGAGLTNMQLISKFNKGCQFSLCVVDIYSKYALRIWVFPLKGITIATAFQKSLDESGQTKYGI